MKCVLCDKRKAKRFCPAKNGMICALCCGEKRVLELDCPENCTYLVAGRERESADLEKLLQNQDPLQRQKNRRILSENQDVIAHLEYTIAQHRLSSRDLKDRDVSQALEILLDTYRTEDKGILYEKGSDDLRVESVRLELKEILESYRNPQSDGVKETIDPAQSRLKLQNAIECLELVQNMINVYSQNRNSDRSYVDFLARMTPKKETKSSIILP